ncbi:hypothetical protein JYT57_01530 [Nitrosarchaeum koreense]|nr:hypothetical protein [Nitrosarchaeum koreense]
MDFETQFMEEKWHKDYDKLKNEHEAFRNYFNKHRTCKCNIDLCKHLQKIEKKMFNPRYYELVNKHIIIGLQTMADDVPELFEKPKLK